MLLLALIQALESEEERQLVNVIFADQYEHMKSIAYKILNNKEDAEDAAMYTACSICQNIHLFKDYPCQQCVNLISLCVKNSAIDIYRKNKRNSERLEVMFDNCDAADDTGIPERILLSKENTDTILNAINSLGEMYSAPLLLKYTHDLGNEDIARLLNIDKGTVAGRLFRGRKMLAQILTKEGIHCEHLC